MKRITRRERAGLGLLMAGIAFAVAAWFDSLNPVWIGLSVTHITAGRHLIREEK